MCLAIPGKIIACADEQATIDLQGNRLKVSTVLTPEAAVGDWVLAHAGFAISLIEESDALETWEWLRAMSVDPQDQSPPPHDPEAGS
jgi:hydrogenase expression/formation protein HypC